MLPVFSGHGIHINARLSGWESFRRAVRIKRREEFFAGRTYKLGRVIDRQAV